MIVLSRLAQDKLDFGIVKLFQDKYEIKIKVVEAIKSKKNPAKLIEIAHSVLSFGHLDEAFDCLYLIFDYLSQLKITKTNLVKIRTIYDQFVKILREDYKSFIVVRMTKILINYNEDLQNLDFLYFCSKVLQDLESLDEK